MAERHFTGGMTSWSVDIGADGGVLTYDASRPVAVWKINGKQVSEADAWAWVFRWHAVRDAATGQPPCICTPCSWVRSKRDRRLGP